MDHVRNHVHSNNFLHHLDHHRHWFGRHAWESNVWAFRCIFCDSWWPHSPDCQKRISNSSLAITCVWILPKRYHHPSCRDVRALPNWTCGGTTMGTVEVGRHLRNITFGWQHGRLPHTHDRRGFRCWNVRCNRHHRCIVWWFDCQLARVEVVVAASISDQNYRRPVGQLIHYILLAVIILGLGLAPLNDNIALIVALISGFFVSFLFIPTVCMEFSTNTRHFLTLAGFTYTLAYFGIMVSLLFSNYDLKCGDVCCHFFLTIKC